MALESFPPLALLSLRYLISGSLMLAAVLWRGAALPRGRDLRNAVVSGVVALGVGNGALVIAETRIPSGLAGLFITIAPFWMVGIEALLPGGQSLHLPTILGMLVGLAGAALLVAPDILNHTFSGNILSGFLILQVGMSCWALGSIFQKRQKSETHPIVVGTIHQLAVGIFALPLALLLPEHPIYWNWRGVGAMMYLVVFGSIVGYSAYAYALNRLPVAIVSVHSYINSIVAVALGWLVYHEPFGWLEASAMIIIFIGVGIVKWTTRQSLSNTLAPSAPPAVQNTAITVNRMSKKNR